MSLTTPGLGAAAPGQQSAKPAGSKTTAKRRPVKVKVPQLSVVRRPRSDLDVANLKLQGKDLSANLSQAIADGSIDATIEGASTFSLTVSDWYHGLLRSELLAGKVTLTFDGLSFTLAKIAAADDKMTLTFEETAVNLLRGYDNAKKADRANTTRAQFVRSMVQEVKEAQIPFRCPEVNVKQKIAGGGALSSSGPKPGQAGANAGGWITTGATWFPDCQGYKGDNLCDGGLYYAELGVAGANGHMGGLLGPALGDKTELPYKQKLEIQFRGRTATAVKGDIGSGQTGQRHYTIDLHKTLAEKLGFTGAGKADVRVRKVN